MARFDTSKGRSVAHCHVPNSPCNGRNMTSEETAEARAWMSRNFPRAVELRVASWRYNCHGYAYTDAHAWFDDPGLFIADDFSVVPLNSAQTGDVVLYMNGQVITHSAIVTKVSQGKIMKVRSKWGVMPAVRHDPSDVLPAYGKPARLLRPS
ncbi:MAG: CHAP domain-containing protein [Pyrinomonadaceae bacterium]|nr:CHAP domain-containing protein [Pyrinomonadaceae bacterium]